MEKISRGCLELSIISMAINRERILDRIARVSDEVLDEEELSETVMEIDKILGELSDLYSRYSVEQNSFEKLYNSAVEEYRKDRMELLNAVS